MARGASAGPQGGWAVCVCGEVDGNLLPAVVPIAEAADQPNLVFQRRGAGGLERIQAVQKVQAESGGCGGREGSARGSGGAGVQVY
jgi:hypothetical protein